jgi:hypothetical protein
MKITAMYPGFFPYLGHFDLANISDVYLIYDLGQYRRHSWINRNRVLHPTSGWQYIILPLQKHHFTVPIDKVQIAANVDWQTTIFKKLQHYHMDAPYYSDVIKFLQDCFSFKDSSLVRLTTRVYRAVCERLNIATPTPIFSELEPDWKPVMGPENLALAICRALGADEYITPPGRADLYKGELFARHGIKLTVQSFANMTYPCGRFQFEPGLSIIDVMMWNSCEDIKTYLDTFRIPSKKISVSPLSLTSN